MFGDSCFVSVSPSYCSHCMERNDWSGMARRCKRECMSFFPPSRTLLQTSCVMYVVVMKMGFLESLWHHKAFSCGLILLFVLLVTNQYQKALAPQMCVFLDLNVAADLM